MLPQPRAARAFRIGSILVDPPLALAPMEEVSNQAFRRICKRIARPGLVFTEFVSAMAVHFNPSRSLRKMFLADDERPAGIQIFGADPQVMAETARQAEALGADLIDLNMGCWVPKVCRTGSGAALLKDPDAAVRIVESVVAAVQVPVTIKVRAGWHYGQFAAPGLAVRFEEAGAQALTLHARFAKQGYEGKADWSLIGELKAALEIPVLGNGDVRTPADALRMMEETGCDGVMVGRAAISNPWALAKIAAALRGEPTPPEPTLAERLAVAREHVVLHVEQVGNEARAVKSLRGQLPLYVKHVPGAAHFRKSLSLCSSLAEVDAVFAEVLGE